MKTWLLLLFAVGAAAQTTSVTGTITDPAGDLVSGSCIIQTAQPFTAASSEWTVVGAPMTVSFTSGAFSVTLAPTDTASPSGQYYKVTCAVPKQTMSGRSVGPYSWGPNYWLVPTNSSSLNIGQVVVSPPPTPSFVIQWQQMAPLAGVQAGQAPVWNGSSWQPGAVTGFTYTPENVANKGAANGYAPLDASQFVPAANIPGLTGDVVKNAGSNATTVAAIRNYPVTTGAPADGQLMRWSASAGQWLYVSHVVQEVPAGTIDGTNTAFTLANAPNPATGLVLTLNGLTLHSGTDFTLSGNAITFIQAGTPQPGDLLLGSYEH